MPADDDDDDGVDYLDEPTDDEDAALGAWYDHKSTIMETMLGPEHNMVMHALIPYSVGGGLDLYYYPDGVAGTGIATKELSEKPGEGSSNKRLSCYELVMFTPHAIDLDEARDESTPFGAAHTTINAILNRIAPYSAQASLNANETCEFPAEMKKVGGRCLIFDEYGHHSDDVVQDFGLLLIIEIFRSEMNHARKHGGADLIKKLKAHGIYPYSNLDRKPVA